jgi:hypothetical protein
VIGAVSLNLIAAICFSSSAVRYLEGGIPSATLIGHVSTATGKGPRRALEVLGNAVVAKGAGGRMQEGNCLRMLVAFTQKK